MERGLREPSVSAPSRALLPILVIALVLALALALAAAGCGANGSFTSTADSTAGISSGSSGTADALLAGDQVLRINMGQEPPSLDPDLAADVVSANIINNIFEGLLRLEPSGEVSPGAAERWEVSSDGLTYTFFLRGTDQWTDGHTVTSGDFKASWLRILDPSTAADYAYLLYPIEGAEEFNSGQGPARDVAIDASDSRVLKVTLTAKTSYFLVLMTHQAFFPVPTWTVDSWGDGWTEPEHIVSNGPYRLVSWRHDSDLVLEKWAGFREASRIQLQTIRVGMIGETTTGVAAFDSGEMDVQQALPTVDMSRLKKLPEYRVYPELGVAYYGFNTATPPLDDPRVRKALALAIDRQALVDCVMQGDQRPATGLVPAGVKGFSLIRTDFLKPMADRDGALKLLADAGFPNGRGLPEIVISHPSTEGQRAVATAVQEQWRQIGATVRLQSMEWKQYLDYVQNSDQVMVYAMLWTADYADPYTFLDSLRGGGGNNYTRWADPTFDQALDDALTLSSESERYRLYGRMERLVSVDEMPVAPLFWSTNPELVKDYVAGYEPNPLGQLLNLWTVRILKH